MCTKRRFQWLDNVSVNTSVTEWTFFRLPIESKHLLRVTTACVRATTMQIAHSTFATFSGVGLHVNKISGTTDYNVEAYVLVLSIV